MKIKAYYLFVLLSIILFERLARNNKTELI